MSPIGESENPPPSDGGFSLFFGKKIRLSKIFPVFGSPMIKVAQIELKPDTRQKELLTETLRTANKACDEISSVAFEEKLFVSRHALQQKVYYAGLGKVPLVILADSGALRIQGVRQLQKGQEAGR